MKKRKMPSRRRRGFRRVLIAAAAVFLVNRIFLVGLLFPIQTVRCFEERQNTGRTAVVYREWAPEIYRSQMVYLTENENVTMLSGAYLTYLGWMNGFGVVLDCSEEAPIHGGWWAMNRQPREKNLFYIFGRIDDPEIVRIEAVTQQDVWEAGEVTRRDISSRTSEREDWMEKDGRYYFLFRQSRIDWSMIAAPIHHVAAGYDEAGNEIARVELDQGWSSSYS